MTESRPQTKTELLAFIQAGWDDLHARLSQLSETQLTTPNPSDGWAIKDHLTHLAAWEMGMAALLQHEPRYQAMGLAEEAIFRGEVDYNGMNEAIFRQHQGKSLVEAQDYLRMAHEALLAALAELSDEDLQHSYSFYQPDEPGEDNGSPIITWVMGNTYEHYQEHWPWIAAALQTQ